ncbi:MAG: prepilin peptidase [Nibricoccus sp.]
MYSYYAEVSAGFPWFFPTAAFLFGAIVGSFLNVVIYRVPAGKSIVRPGSHCACGQPIAWYDNIPILSWFILRGRARCCGRPYSVRYPFIEFLTGALFLCCWLRFSHASPLAALSGMVFVSILICATFIDLDHMIIPDTFTIWFGLIAVLLSWLVPALHVTPSGNFANDSLHSLFLSVKGLFIGSALVLWIALLAEMVLRREAMGFGDVKFVGMIGAFCGWQGAVCSIFGGAIVGTVWFVIALTWQKLFPRSPAIPPKASETDHMDETTNEAPSDALVALNNAALCAGVIGLFVAVFRPAFAPTTDLPFLVESVQSFVFAFTSLLIGSGAILCVGIVIETPMKKDWLPAYVVTFAGAVGAFSLGRHDMSSLFWATVQALIVTGILYVILRAISALKKRRSSAETVVSPPLTSEADEQPPSLGFGVQVPFGPMLAIAALIYYLGGDKWIAVYLEQFNSIF